MSLEKLVIDNIKRLRKEKGISQEKLAKACNTATSYIGLMEIYRNVPKLSTIERIAEALEVDSLVLFKKQDCLSEQKEENLQKIKAAILDQVETGLDRTLRAFL